MAGIQPITTAKRNGFLCLLCFEPRLYDDMVLPLTFFGMRVKKGKDTSYHFQSYDFMWDRPTMFVNMNIEQPLELIPQSNELSRGPPELVQHFRV